MHKCIYMHTFTFTFVITFIHCISYLFRVLFVPIMALVKKILLFLLGQKIELNGGWVQVITYILTYILTYYILIQLSSSGCAPFYNTDVEENTNTKMIRNFAGNDFQIYAKRFIKKVINNAYICIYIYIYIYMCVCMYMCVCIYVYI